MSSIRMTCPIPRGQSNKICKPKKILYCNYKFYYIRTKVAVVDGQHLISLNLENPY